jgi:hypothetical protein
VLYEAIGTFGQGRLQLLEGAVRIVRGSEIETIPFDEIGELRLVPSTSLHSGSLSFPSPGTDVGEEAAVERTIHFNGRQQRHFEEIARRVQARMSGTVIEEPVEPAGTVVATEPPRGPLLSRLFSTPTAPPKPSPASYSEVPDARPAASVPQPTAAAPTVAASAPAIDHVRDSAARVTPSLEQQLTQLVSVAGRMALTARGESSEEISLGAVLELTDAAISRSRSRVDTFARTLSEGGNGFDHLGAEYLVAAAHEATKEAAVAHEATIRAAKGGGRSLFGGRPSNPWASANRCVGAVMAATSLLSVLDGYVEAESADHAWIRESSMYEALTTGLAAVSRQLYPVVHDPRASTPMSVEPFFANATETMKGLRGVISDRQEDLPSLVPSRRAGAAYVLEHAVDAWERSVNSLGEARQLYLAAREWWPGQAALVVEGISATMGHLLVGQSLVVTADVYAAQSGMPEMVNLSPTA